jgi:hypothetical protein
MAETETQQPPEEEKQPPKDLLSRLADAGEDALRRLNEAPGVDRALSYARTTRKQLDELTKRVQGISALEARIAKLEEQVAALSAERVNAVADQTVPPAQSVPPREPPPTAAP